MKETICSLIQDDIKYTQLMNKLESAGFAIIDHDLKLSDTIFILAGVENSPFIDEVSIGYFDLVKKYNNSPESTSIKNISNSLCDFLMGFSNCN
jgi:hypothetical protein